MAPWLLLIIAALIVVSVSLYSHARQVETHALGRQLLVAEELRDAEAALHAALEKLRQMDTVLAIREHTLTREGQVLIAMEGRSGPVAADRGQAVQAEEKDAPDAPDQPDPQRPLSPVPEPSPRIGSFEAGGRDRMPDAVICRSDGASPSARPGLSPAREWPARARELAAAGATAAQIARELEVPAGEVELVLALNARRSSLF